MGLDPRQAHPPARLEVRAAHCEELRSLRSLFAEMPDCRRGQGMRHKLLIRSPAGGVPFARLLPCVSIYTDKE